MSKKVLTIVGLTLALCWSLNAAKVDIDSKVDKTKSHVATILKNSPTNVSVVDTREYDALVSGGTRRNVYVTGRGTADTLAQCPSSAGQFIFSPGEYDLVTYVMPADGIIKGINPEVFAWAPEEGQQLEVSIWKVTYPVGSDGELYPLSAVDGAGWAGYWTDGENDTIPMFVTDTTAGAAYFGGSENDSGPCGGSAPVPHAQDLVMEKVWPPSDFVHATFTPESAPAQEDNWIATIDYGGEPEFLAGAYVGILIENQGAEGSDATGFYYCEGDGVVPRWVFAKFYNECNGTSGEGGWHIRHWLLDWPLAVELTGDRPPIIQELSALPTTLSTEDREVTATITDDNPSGGEAGVAAAKLHYQVAGAGAPVVVEMTGDGDVYTATIPGQDVGSSVRWYINAVDVEGLWVSSTDATYKIFAPKHEALFFYNSSQFGQFIQGYYLYPVPVAFRTDYWSFGDGTATLFDNYETVIEVSGGGPNWCNAGQFASSETFLADWLDEGNKNYIVAGDEFLGSCFYGWLGDSALAAGDPNYDLLGIAHYYPDINYAVAGDDAGVSRLLTVADDPISGGLHTYLADSLDLNYDPDYEIGAPNWLDGVDPTDDATVSFYAISGVVDPDTGFVADADTHAAGLYMEFTNGSKTAFFGFDVLSLNTVPSYHWIGINALGALGGALDWLGVMAIDKDIVRIPVRFSLRQNYPNPFNPVTSISFDLPNDGKVSLTVYNMLGQKVSTLVNDYRRAGRHTVTWNGRSELGHTVSTGVYLYRIEVGDFSATKKMVLLK